MSNDLDQRGTVANRLQWVDDNSLGSLIRTEINQAGNWAGSEFREAIRQSLDYFLMRTKGDEVPGRSHIQSGDVADMVDHVQAELQPAYNVDTLFKIQQEGPDDNGNEIETQAVNWYWRERCRGAEKLDEAVQSGLLSRNGYLKVWFEKSYGLPYMQELVGDELQIAAELARLSEDDNEVELVSVEVEQEATYIEVSPLAESTAMVLPGAAPMQALEVSPAIYRIEAKIIPTRNEVLVASVAPEDCFVSRDAVGSDMQAPRFVAQRRRMTRQDIKSLGFWSVDVDQMEIASDYNEDVKNARQSDDNTYTRSAADPDGQLVDLFECYYKVDRDRDGVPEMWKVFSNRSGKILHWDEDGLEGEVAAEMVRVRPFASGSPMKVAHRHQGRSLFDKEKEVEDFGRQLLRQMVDNMAEANNTTTVYGDSVNDEDIEETEVGRAIRANTADVLPLKHNNIIGDSIGALAYKDKIRRERGGSSIDVSRENAPVQQAAHSTERIMSAMERIVSMYARNFANNLIRDTGVLLHEQMKLLPGKIAFEGENGWQEVEPRYWIQRNRISVTMGDSEGERMRKIGALERVIQTQREDAASGFSVLVDPAKAYEARIDRDRTAGLINPQQYWVNPESPEGQQAAQAMAQQAQQERELAMAQQQALLQSQMEAVRMQEQTKRMSDQLDALEAQRDRLADLMKSMTKLEVENGVRLPFGVADESPPAGFEAPGQVQ